MKSTILTFLLISAFLHISNAQWEEKNIPTNLILESVDFLNNDVGFVVGGDKIFKTIDGGENWETSYTSTGSTFLSDVYIIKENNIIAVGKNFVSNKSVILRTIDNGLNWDLTELSSSSNLQSIFFTSDSIGYCVGSGGDIFKTTDSGINWETLDSGTMANLQSIYFVNDSVGIVAGGAPNSGAILKTQDAGISWDIINSPSDDYLQSAYFTNEQTGYIVGWNGEIIKTEDCGSTWITQNAVNMFGNLDVVFTDENTGYIVGGEAAETSIQKTYNGGESWEDISPDFSVGLAGVTFPSFDVGYAVGANGAVLKTENGGIVLSNSNLFTNEDFLLYPNPTSNFVTVESNENDIIQLIKVYNETGQLITQKAANSAQSAVDFSSFASGNYYIHIATEGKQAIKKLVKK